MSTVAEYGDIFEGVAAEMEASQIVVDGLKEKVKIVDEAYRHCNRMLAQVHTHEPSVLPQIGENILQSQQFRELREVLHDLVESLSSQPYYKYNGLWSHSLQNAIYLVLMCRWLSDHKLAPPAVVAQVLELRVESDALSSSGFDFTFEEYLHATITLVSELSRLAINSVTSTASANAGKPGSESYSLPLAIDKFLKDIQAGFLALNLKNDSLRRRSDAIKYDVKKVEEIVYDLALRGLISRS